MIKVSSELAILLFDTLIGKGAFCCVSKSEDAESVIIDALRGLKSAGASPKTTTAKIIGAVDGSVGSANLKAVKAVLNVYGVEVVREVTGGSFARHIQYNTNTHELQYRQEDSKISVLIIDDSAPMRKVIRKMIESDPQIEIMGEAASTAEAERIRKNREPNIITLDLQMPVQDGVSYLRQYMPLCPTPTIIVTDYNLKATGPVMDALDAGAFDYIQKPEFSQMKEAGETLVAKIKAAAKSKLRKSNVPVKHLRRSAFQNKNLDEGMIAIGASTGGTEALKTLLLGLPAKTPPILIVQHMPEGFTKSFADRMNELCPFRVKEAENGEVVQSSCVYIAPGGKQMGVSANRSELRIVITDDPPENRFKPSVDFLFRSFGKIKGRHRVAAILTGMGGDGAKEMLQLKLSGVFTIAQDETTSAVFGMPKVAIDMGAVCEVKKLGEIAEAISGALNQRAAA